MDTARSSLESLPTRHEIASSPSTHNGSIDGIQTAPVTRRPTNVEVSRIETHRLYHQSTVASKTGRTPKDQWLPFGGEKDYPPDLPDPDIYVVEFAGEKDPMHPHNWPTWKKVINSTILAYSTFVSSFASAIFSSALGAISPQFGISTEVATLGVTLYVLGFASGPTLWAPASELYGRRWPITIGLIGYSIFTIGTATAKDVQTIMLTRFFAGFFAASPLSIVPAVFADLYNNQYRGVAIAMFAMAVFVGPFASPFTGGFITMSYLGWRWTMYISAIMGFLASALLLLFFRESYAPIVLMEKAATLRRQTRNWGIHAKQDEVELDLNELITVNFSRPFRMLFTEPIVFLVTLYMSFIYGLMYALLGAYPVVFQGIHGMNLGVGSLTFIGLIIGEVLGGVYTLLGHGSYLKKLQANNNVPIPEWRLPGAIVGGIAFTLGLFWFGWTGFTEDVHWMAPTASGVFVGFGIFSIFLQCFNYLIDSYLTLYVPIPMPIAHRDISTDNPSAASVFAANTILRSAVGACFPLFSRQMFTNLGVQWAGTLLGCLGAIMIPIPLAFIAWGPPLRRRSKFAPTAAVFHEKSSTD